MPIPAADIRVAEIVVKSTLAALGGDAPQVSNVYYYRRTAVVIAPSKTSLITKFASDVFAPLLLASHERYASHTANIRWLNDAEDPVATIAMAGTGAIATDALPPQATVRVLLKTALRGKKYRGSKAFTAIPEIHTTGDVLTGGGLTLWQAVRDALLLSLTDADGNIWKPCVFSRKLSQIKKNATTVITNDITSCVLNKNVTGMKRRRIRRVI